MRISSPSVQVASSGRSGSAGRSGGRDPQQREPRAEVVLARRRPVYSLLVEQRDRHLARAEHDVVDGEDSPLGSMSVPEPMRSVPSRRRGRMLAGDRRLDVHDGRQHAAEQMHARVHVAHANRCPDGTQGHKVCRTPRVRSFLRSAAAVVLGIGLLLGLGELALRALGLGDPVLYDNRLAWGYRPLPDQTRSRLFGARVHVNALGVRGPDVAATRPPDTTRLLFLGDSVTWGGSYVDDDALFAAVAARRLARDGRRVEWLDAGVNGWGPENILGFVRETGGFDASTWIVTGLADALRREKTHAGEVPYFMIPPATASEEILVRGAYAVLTSYKQAKPEADLARLAMVNLGHVAAIVEHGRAVGARVLLVWHPTTDALASGADPRRDPFLAVAARTGSVALDLTAAYRAAGGQVYYDGMHLDVPGHRVAGEAIGEALVRMGS